MIGTRIGRMLANIPSSMTETEQAIKRIPGLERAAGQVADTIHNAVLRGGDQTRAVVDALHGTWLGHPLHAALTDIPIGAWALAAMFDAYAGLGGGAHAERTADALIAIGVAAAVPTALAGVADYSAIDQGALAVGGAHALLNSAGLGLYLLSIRARANGRRGSGVLLSTLGLAVVSASAGLGGDLVYRLRVGVNHTPPASEPQEWTRVLALDEIADHQARRVDIGDTPVLLYRDGESIYAIGAVCSHAGGPLEEGSFTEQCVECPWHQSVFDLRDGRVVHGPATMSQPSYEARIRDRQIEIRLKPELGSAAEGAQDAQAPGQGRTREVGGEV